MKGWKELRPNGRQLAEYCGEDGIGFDYIRFSKGPGRTEAKEFASEESLAEFLDSGGFTRFPCVYVKARGYKSKRKARVHVGEGTLVVAMENGITVSRMRVTVSNSYQEESYVRDKKESLQVRREKVLDRLRVVEANESNTGAESALGSRYRHQLSEIEKAISRAEERDEMSDIDKTETEIEKTEVSKAIEPHEEQEKAIERSLARVSASDDDKGKAKEAEKPADRKRDHRPRNRRHEITDEDAFNFIFYGSLTPPSTEYLLADEVLDRHGGFLDIGAIKRLMKAGRCTIWLNPDENPVEQLGGEKVKPTYNGFLVKNDHGKWVDPECRVNGVVVRMAAIEIAFKYRYYDRTDTYMMQVDFRIHRAALDVVE